MTPFWFTTVNESFLRHHESIKTDIINILLEELE